MNQPYLRLQFQKAEGLIGRLIAAHDGGEFSHVELQFVFPQVAYSAHLKDGGTRFVREDFTQLKWVGVDLPIYRLEDEERIRQWCELTRRKYSLRNIAAFTTPIPAEGSEGAVICSEVCLMAIQQVLHLTDQDPATVSPNALYKLVTQ